MAGAINFGTDGWRSLTSTDFVEENVKLVAQAIANYLYKQDLPQKGVFIGYDTRAQSSKFADTVAQVLARNGIAANKSETFCPTPLAAYSVTKLGMAGAVMITASHNPPDFNGIKFIPQYGGPATVEITDDIEWEIEDLQDLGTVEPPPDRSIGPLKSVDVSNDYIKNLLSMVEKSVIERSRVKIVFDPMFGAGQNTMMRTLHNMDCIVIPVHCFLDPDFGGILPDPNKKNLKDCAEKVLESKADIGVALDGDADRFGVVDSIGTYLTANQALTLILWYLLTFKDMGGAVARTLATTHMLDTVAEHNGCRVIETPVGFKYVGELMRKKSIIMAAEESGGMSIGGHIPEKDGILAGLLLIEIVARFKKPLSVLLDDIYKEFGPCIDERIDIEVKARDKKDIIESLKDNPPRKLGGEEVVKVDLRDGVKLVTADGNWGLVRASGTEPVIRVYVEGRSQVAFDRVKNNMMKLIKKK